MDKIPDKLTLGKGSSFVKSRLSRLPRTDEVWEADIRPISVRGWNARRHGELWLGMVMTRLESFHLALLASQEEVMSLTISELVRLAIATAGDPARLSAEADRNIWVRLSD